MRNSNTPPAMQGHLIVFLALLAVPARAHELQYTVEHGPAVSVKLFAPDGEEFAFRRYEVYRAGETGPFQTGRTDIQGRLAFLPDRPGEWLVKAFSEDGHGVDISITTDAKGAIQGAAKPVFERYPRVITGVALIVGVFGLINLLARRKRTT